MPLYGGDPTLGAADAANAYGGQSNPIIDFLRRMRQASWMQPAVPQPTEVTGFGRDQSFGAYSPQTQTVQPQSPQQQGQRGLPVGYGTGAMEKRPDTLPQPSFSASLKNPQLNYANPEGSFRMEGVNDISDKLNPTGNISFGWNGDALQKFDPSKGLAPSDQLTASRARGFMGRAGNPSGGSYVQGGGELVNGQTDWSKVANPMAFSAYTERPERADIERYMQDPTWREKANAQIEQQKQIAVDQAHIQATQAAIQDAARRTQAQIDAEVRPQIDAENKARAAQGKPPLSPAEENSNYYMPAYQRAQGKFGLM